MAQGSLDGQLRRGHVHGVGRVGAGRDVAGHHHAVELFQKVEMEPTAAELAVGDGLHTGSLQLGDGLGDGVILDMAKFLGRDIAGRPLGPSIVDSLGPEKAADMVGAERRVDAVHWVPLAAGCGAG